MLFFRSESRCEEITWVVHSTYLQLVVKLSVYSSFLIYFLKFNSRVQNYFNDIKKLLSSHLFFKMRYNLLETETDTMIIKGDMHK